MGKPSIRRQKPPKRNISCEDITSPCSCVGARKHHEDDGRAPTVFRTRFPLPRRPIPHRHTLSLLYPCVSRVHQETPHPCFTFFDAVSIEVLYRADSEPRRVVIYCRALYFSAMSTSKFGHLAEAPPAQKRAKGPSYTIHYTMRFCLSNRNAVQFQAFFCGIEGLAHLLS